MVTAQNLLYSVSAARRILGIYYPEIKVSIQVWKSVVWIHRDGRRPTLISKSVFKRHFVEWRQQQAKDIAIARDFYLRGTFHASNGSKGTTYKVVIGKENIFCGCEDYKNQVQFFKKGVCKHGYAVLNYLGFNNLQEWIKSRELAALLAA